VVALLVKDNGIENFMVEGIRIGRAGLEAIRADLLEEATAADSAGEPHDED